MCERDVVICDFVEEVYFALVEKKTGSDGMHWSITPTFVEETAVSVEALKKVNVSLGPKPFEVPNFKVGPLRKLARVNVTEQETYEVTFVVRLTTVIAEKRQ